MGIFNYFFFVSAGVSIITPGQFAQEPVTEKAEDSREREWQMLLSTTMHLNQCIHELFIKVILTVGT